MKCAREMFEKLGYEWYHDYPKELGGKHRYDAFIPKRKCNCHTEIKRKNFIPKYRIENKLEFDNEED